MATYNITPGDFISVPVGRGKQPHVTEIIEVTQVAEHPSAPKKYVSVQGIRSNGELRWASVAK